MTRIRVRGGAGVVAWPGHLEDPMALAEQHEIFRAYIMMMAEAPAPLPPAEALERLAEGAREGAAARVARELAGRRPEPDAAR